MVEFGKRNPDRQPVVPETPLDLLRKNIRKPEINAPVMEVIRINEAANNSISDRDRTDISRQYSLIRDGFRKVTGTQGSMPSDQDISDLIQERRGLPPRKE